MKKQVNCHLKDYKEQNWEHDSITASQTSKILYIQREGRR